MKDYLTALAFGRVSHARGGDVTWTKRFFFRITSLAWSPDGTGLAVGLARGVALLDALAGTTVATLSSAEVRALSWSSDGALLATGGQDGRIQVWDAATAITRQWIVGVDPWCYLLDWSPNGEWLVGRATSTAVCLWDATTGQPRRYYQGHRKKIIAIACSPDSQHIASASMDHVLHLW